MRLPWWCGMALLIVAPMVAGQEPATVPAAPEKEPVEVREGEIIEPPEASETAAAPQAARKVRIVGLDDAGEAHDLENVIGQALEFNPEIRAIRAEIQALMARLEQLEGKITADIFRNHAEVRQLKSKREKDKNLLEKDFITPGELAELDAEIAAREIEMKYLIGREPAVATFTRPADDPLMRDVRIRGELTDRPSLKDLPDSRMKEMLQNPITFQFEDVSFADVADYIQEIYEINITIDLSAREAPVTIALKNVSLQQAFAALSDLTDIVFIIRDYGVLVTTRERAVRVPGPSIPEGVPFINRDERRPFTYVPVNVRQMLMYDKLQQQDAPHVERRELRFKEGQDEVPKPSDKP